MSTSHFRMQNVSDQCLVDMTMNQFNYHKKTDLNWHDTTELFTGLDTFEQKKKNASGYKIDLITLQKKNPIKNFCHKKEDPNAVTNWDRILEYTHYEPLSCSNCQQHCHSLYEMLIQPLSCQGQSMRSGKSSLLSCSRLASLTFSPSAFVPCALGGPGSPGPPRGVY